MKYLQIAFVFCAALLLSSCILEERGSCPSYLTPKKRVKAMVAKMDELGFGNCTNTRACEAECPKCVSISNIARLNREFIKAKLKD